MCNLFRACNLLRRRHFKPKSLKRQDIFFNVRSDRYSFINEEILYNKKGKSQIGHSANSIDVFLVSSITCETLTDGVTWCTVNQVPVILSVYVLYLCTQEMSSFHFQIIALKKFTLWIFTLYVTILTSFQENDPYIILTYYSLSGVFLL